jgi:hypothetical protein
MNLNAGPRNLLVWKNRLVTLKKHGLTKSYRVKNIKQF